MEMEHDNGASAYSQQASSSTNGIRQRPHQPQTNPYATNNFSNTQSPITPHSKSMKRRVVKNIDLFPKIETGLTVQTDQGARLSIGGTLLALTLIIAEWYAWRTTNGAIVQTVVVDTSLNKKMRVDLNISFPALHCDDLHLDLMDVAGDVQLDVDDTMIKRRLHKNDMTYLSEAEVEVKMNKAHKMEDEARDAVKKTLASDYCGPCYGAAEKEGDCCNFCEDVMKAYKKKSWHVEQVRAVAEQCVREHKTGAKAMSKGEGCQIAGYMTFNRLNGNFHIAMGEGVERNGHHIHTFLPDDMENYNASHIIHELRFGPVYDTNAMTSMEEINPLNGVQKIVKKSDGSTGTFQYYLKIVPTTYKGTDLVNSIVTKEEQKQKADTKEEQKQKTDTDMDLYKPIYTWRNGERILETNRYFTTERFVPLMTEELSDENYDLGDLIASTGKDGIEHDDDGTFDDQGSNDDDGRPQAAAKVGGSSGTAHSHHHNHRNKQQILPGVFFIYQIYPFAVEVSSERVPVSHLLIRIMATIGGLFTIVGWLDAFLYSRGKKGRR